MIYYFSLLHKKKKKILKQTSIYKINMASNNSNINISQQETHNEFNLWSVFILIILELFM